MTARGAWWVAAVLSCGIAQQAAAGEPAVRFHTGPGTLWAEAWVSAERGQSALSVRLRNHTLKDVQMSFVGDDYIAQLKDGSLESLRKLEFFRYPTVLEVGQQETIRVSLPPKRRIDDVIALVIRLDHGRTVLALNPPSQAAPAPAAVVTAAPPAPAAESVPTVTLPAAPETRSAGALPPEALPLAEVPVVVEFAQDLGGSLTLQVAWDDGGPSGALRPGERKVFRLAPGPHACRLTSGAQGLAPTAGRVPLAIGREPVRLIVRASVTLDGVTLKVEAWNNVTNDLLLERAFEPGA